MTYHGRPDKARQDRRALELLAQGWKPRQIAAALGCSYSTLRRRLARYVKAIGCRTVEQAVAQLVFQQVRAMLPLAWQGELDRLRLFEKSTP